MGGFLWALAQQKDISNARQSAEEAKAKAGSVLETIRALELRVEKLTLVSHAMWLLLQKTSGLTDAQLAERVRELDLRDGVEDGRIAPTVSQCTACGRTISRRHARCLYCGSEKLNASPFDGV